MVSLLLRCGARDVDMLSASLWELGTSGIAESETPDGRVLVRAFFDAPFDAAPFAAFHPQWHEEEERDWTAEVEAAWAPIEVGERLWLAPPWNQDDPPAGRLRLTIYPGLACGTGRHPATQLCLRALERYVTPGAAVLDVGTGSGVLVAGARVLGAEPVNACDIDPDAIEVAAENLSKDSPDVGLFLGSLRAVRSRSQQLVVANLNAVTLNLLAGDVARVLAPGGLAILAGFTDRDALEVPLERVEQLREENWICEVVRCK